MKKTSGPLCCLVVSLAALVFTACKSPSPIASDFAQATEPSPFQLGSPFSSHMVVQRNMSVPIWGIDFPNRKIIIESGNRKWTATAGADGKWMTEIGPFPVGESFQIHIKGSGETLLEDVLAGEVWLASGQSNMEFALSGSDGAPDAIASANYPNIRLLTIPRAGALEPANFVENNGWKVCTPETAAPFSAVAWYFGRELHEELEVPVGLIAASWGGSNMESWTRLDAMKEDPLLAWTAGMHKHWADQAESSKPLMEEFNRATAEWDANPRPNRHITDPGEISIESNWMEPGFHDDSWETIRAPEQMNLKLGSIDGVIHFRKIIELPSDWAGRELMLSLGSIDDEDVTYLNGTQVGATGPETPSSAQVRRKYSIPKGIAKPGANVIAIRVFDKALGGGMLGPAARMTISPADDGNAVVPLSGEWRYKIAYQVPGKPQPPLAWQPRDVPSMLYNGMIRPLQPFRFRGVIWYQGESNNDRANHYRHLSEVMISDWRRQFGHEFPFLFVQLAGFDVDWPGWIEIMEAQQRTLEVPKTGMAVAADIGAAKDIHPKNKSDVGHRLALAARALVYGEPIVYSGPMVSGAARRENTLRLTFDHVGSGLTGKEGKTQNIKGFELAGIDGEYHPASAMIEGDSVLVSTPQIAQPHSLRYAWRNHPECDLYNKEGLPAPPFRITLTPQ